MGRSVSYLSRAHTVCYYDVSYMGMESVAVCEECDEHYYEPYDDDQPVEQSHCCGVELDYKDNYDEGHCDWDWFIESITDQFRAKYPSLESCSTWEGNEDHIFLENELIEVGVSEYCGLASVSMRAKEDFYCSEAGKLNLANRFAHYVGKWMDVNIGDYNRVGGFSDGTSVYERKDKSCTT